MAPPVTVGRQDTWRALARHDCPNDAGYAGNVGHDMMQLQVHLHQRLLHMLDMRRCVVQQPLPMTEIGAQCCHFGTRGRKLVRCNP
jgi:hypothetical protein